jgi:hypothetical protein
MKTPITQLDTIFLSYDEPNADENWLDLIGKCPWAKRSHGVYGSDNAHKAAAAMSDTERFVIVDADNIVFPEFFNQEIDLTVLTDKDLVSWPAKNTINGLVYGNGGIKSWSRKQISEMRSHENAHRGHKSAQVDFCWDMNYLEMKECHSQIHNNVTPYQAFRAGFREGCKMGLVNGNVMSEFNKARIPEGNMKKLLTWMSIGSDVDNGIWAIYGARLGFWKTNYQRDTWNWISVRDFAWHDDFWINTVSPEFSDDRGKLCLNSGYTWDQIRLWDAIDTLGDKIKLETGMEIIQADTATSSFFKRIQDSNFRHNRQT